jgi:phosphomevalonate kinase
VKAPTRAAAPGKLVLSGAYAVLEGAPAIVCAVQRYAYAFEGPGEATAEVTAALERPPAVDVRELADGRQKLGLGSSAAALVAALALRAAQRGADVAADPARRAIFERAREVHADVQRGGSGVDVAASTFGGVLRYTMSGGAERVSLPPGVRVATLFSGTSARTSDLRGRVDALRERDARAHAARMAALAEAAHAAERAVTAADGPAFVAAIAAAGPALAALGAAADAPIVPEAFAALGAAARADGAAFVPSGAGGGDVGVFVGMTDPSASFLREAARAAMRKLSLDIDFRGVHVAKKAPRTHP